MLIGQLHRCVYEYDIRPGVCGFFIYINMCVCVKEVLKTMSQPGTG